MPQYNLTPNEVSVLVTWLFESGGYLDVAKRTVDGQSAREALTLNPSLDVTQWRRDNAMLDVQQANECAMVWWIWKHDQVNIPPSQRPPETNLWLSILNAWDVSIVTAFGRVGQAQRDSENTIQIIDINSQPAGEIRAGTHLLSQRQIINKVKSVLE